MTTYDVTAITDRNLIARFGLDAREIGEETLRLAESEIGLREWQPTPETSPPSNVCTSSKP